MNQDVSIISVPLATRLCYNSHRGTAYLTRKVGPMPTQEERLSVLERSTATLNAVISDITHNETMLLGMVIRQEENIREIKASLATLNEHLGTFEQSVNSRFEEQGKQLEDHGNKLDQILRLLNRLTPKPDQGT